MDFESRHDFSGVSELKKSTMENELVKKAMNENWRMWSCKTGLQDFTRLLSDKICDKVEVAKNTSVESISREDNGKMRVSLKESLFLYILSLIYFNVFRQQCFTLKY